MVNRPTNSTDSAGSSSSGTRSRRRHLRRLKWVAISAPVGFVGLLEYALYALGPTLNSWQGHALLGGVLLMGALFVYGAVFTIVDQMQQELEKQNRELESLRVAGLDVTAELSLDTVLRKVVGQACNLIGARYGALSVYDESDLLQSFVTSGISDDERAQIGSPPVGKGLLAVVLKEGERLRLTDLRRDERSYGFPPHHPEMRSLLAVPVVCSGPRSGNLYLSEKDDGSEFTEDEEKTLARFATQAAIAIDNAYLHLQVHNLAVVEERLRIAREMHDGQAQVLAYVNTKAQAVKEFLRSGRTDDASQQLEQLASAAREVYADVREGILGLRVASQSKDGFIATLRDHLELWKDQCGIRVALVVNEEPSLRPDIELQLMRIIQEALANVRKHSGASHVRVEVRTLNRGVKIVVKDDGVGFAPETLGRSQIPRFGLATMRERAEAIGATLRIQSEIDKGTRVEVEYLGTQ